jgi:hypothetical protein
MATRKIAGYTITREHARGGMGTVYQALSPEGAMVAIKTVLWPESVDPRTRWEAIERFQREARAASSLSHPNICQVLDFGADEDSLYIVMEFLEGNTVRQLIGDAGAIKVDRAVEIVSSVGEALAHAHDQGIIHRDVKPENIMILRGGQAKLTDFGLASVASQQTMTMPGTTMGTMSYMSPEQVRGEKVDARSDIFSLDGGACLPGRGAGWGGEPDPEHGSAADCGCAGQHIGGGREVSAQGPRRALPEHARDARGPEDQGDRCCAQRDRCGADTKAGGSSRSPWASACAEALARGGSGRCGAGHWRAGAAEALDSTRRRTGDH